MNRRPHRHVRKKNEDGSMEVHFTSIGLLDRLKLDLAAVDSSQVRFEDFLYVNVREKDVKRVWGKFRRFTRIQKLKYRRNADCDNWAVWLWSYMMMDHAKREDTLAEAVAFGIVKFRLDERAQYGKNAQWHMVNWFIDENSVLRFWEPNPAIPERELILNEREKQSVCFLQAW